ncbi:uncharacterized protein MELLADRAFT_103582 [Melampsora larici-populina 98AG31]|uniref:Uncharacterized protein n=1 Tax=Melampsora larici-populina (strain 98AG31 / pathotype 3-4-7) TaxID=747676 RepID=F4RBT7_MELLP|nr:uncharacterized protein MELLADRAFT_103582 [Melampsora larici-populina 98AG31]EGG10282.1 hypothetical protein MELLADRAFT_103582 [Melampsora larici-populina 98AG31]
MALTGGLVMSRPLQKCSLGLQRSPSNQAPSFKNQEITMKTRASSAPFNTRQASTDEASLITSPQGTVISKNELPSLKLVQDGVPTDVVDIEDSQLIKKHTAYLDWQNLVDPGDFCLETGPNCRSARLKASNEAKGNKDRA